MNSFKKSWEIRGHLMKQGYTGISGVGRVYRSQIADEEIPLIGIALPELKLERTNQPNLYLRDIFKNPLSLTQEELELAYMMSPEYKGVLMDIYIN